LNSSKGIDPLLSIAKSMSPVRETNMNEKTNKHE